MKPKQEDPKEMVGGCCVCSDENGWAENPLVYCDGQGCNVAVHQACYGIVTVPTGAWFCRKCESQERAARVRCELCPSKDGALKRTDSGGWAHVVCALYIPEVRFGNVTTMEPIMLQLIPQERFNKSCYLCDEAQRGSKATIGACMQCNRAGCKNHFHVTCAQAMGLLCEEAGNYLDNVKYCGYCQYHYNKLRRGSHVKTIPPYRPVPHDALSSDEDKATSTSDSKDRQKRRSGKSSPVHESGKHLTRDVKVNLGDMSGPSKAGVLGAISGESSSQEEPSVNMDFSLNLGQGSLLNVKSETKVGDKVLLNTSGMPNLNTTTTTTTIPTLASNKQMNFSASLSSDSKTTTGTFLSSCGLSHSTTTVTSSSASSSSGTAGPSVSSSSESTMGNVGLTVTPSTSVSSTISTSTASTTSDNATTVVSTVISLPSKIKTNNAVSPATSSHATPPSLPVPIANSSLEKDRQRKTRRNGSGSRSSSVVDEIGIDESSSNLVICEERNLSSEKTFGKSQTSSEDKLNVHFTTNVSVSAQKQLDTFSSGNADAIIGEPMKRARSGSQDRGRRSKRGASSVGSAPAPKRGRVAMSSREKESSRDSGASSPESLSPETLQTKRGGRGTAKTTPEVKETKENTLTSVITNGVGANALLLGNQINPASAVAQKMADTLHAELEAHSIYKDEEKVNINLIGPALPGKKESSSPGAILNAAQPPPLPQSLEQLLERQWEQGSQFLMEQAQHFDIASLLSCLHQLRQENVRLEETVNSLIARRDHLLAVNARLSVPLVSTQSTTHASTSTALTLSSSLAGTTGIPSTSSHSTILANTASLVAVTPTAPPPPPISTALIASQLQITHSSNLPSTAVMASSRGVHPSQQRHPSGGSAHIIHSTPSSSISGGRGTSPHDRRNPHQGPPLENGLAEPEYRYRSPGTDHHPRQQSPMLPPGAQPSPTSLRQSPASSTYHSGSPHAGVPSLSPSGVPHPQPPPQHPLVAHGSHSGHPSVLASSSHGPPHTVALSRTSDHTRAELLRIASTQAQATPGVGYGQVYMVSPPVPGPHHSPVGMQQHPSHSQVRRMEVVETGRGSHTLEKR